jgi:hypothetical protein
MGLEISGDENGVGPSFDEREARGGCLAPAENRPG